MAASLESFIEEGFFLSPLHYCFAYVYELIIFAYHKRTLRGTENVKNRGLGQTFCQNQTRGSGSGQAD